VDGCNLLPRSEDRPSISYSGIGRGRSAPSNELTEAVLTGFRAVERGVANELEALIQFLNRAYARTPFEQVSFAEVQRLAATCGTGCRIVEPGAIEPMRPVAGFGSRLVARALGD
jgi:hypothetical protein